MDWTIVTPSPESYNHIIVIQLILSLSHEIVIHQPSLYPNDEYTTNYYPKEQIKQPHRQRSNKTPKIERKRG